MHDRPDETGELERLVGADEPRPLLFDKCVDEHLERRGAFALELRVSGEPLECAAEHHPVVGRIRDRESDVRLAHGLESASAFPRLFPGGD